MRIFALLPLFSLVFVVACSETPPEQSSDGVVSGDATLLEGFRLIVGDGSAPVDDAALLIEGPEIRAVGRRGEVDAPTGARRIDLDGKTVMPALVSLHGHVGFQNGLTYAEENYTRENVADHLDRYAYYGVGTIVSMGTDAGDLVFDIRDEQAAGTLGGARLLTAGRGLARPNAGPGAAALRGSAWGVSTPDEAREAVGELAAREVDVVKIWVDDRGGSVEKLGPELYSVIIEEAHTRDMVVIAHVFYEADAIALVNAGVDGFAHLVRDVEMSAELVDAIRANDVFVMPNLGISERGAHPTPPIWLEAAGLHESVAPAVIARAKQAMAESFSRRPTGGLQRSRESYQRMQASLRKLHAAGARLVLGADTGVRDHFYGFTELRELELMAAAGLPTAEVLEIATSRSAETLGINAGLLAAGRSADLLVLDADPLENINNVHAIHRVFLRGVEVDRAGLRRAWSGSP